MNRLARSFLWMSLLAVAGCETAAIKDSYVALDGQGVRKRTRFFTDTESIHCVAELANGREDTTLVVQLRSEELHQPGAKKPEKLRSVLAAEESVVPLGSDAVLSFEWKKPDEDTPYPAGSFLCEFYLNGELLAEAPFQVEYPECPVAPILPGASCEGFVAPGQKCPGAREKQTCQCSQGVWSC